MDILARIALPSAWTFVSNEEAGCWALASPEQPSPQRKPEMEVASWLLAILTDMA